MEAQGAIVFVSWHSAWRRPFHHRRTAARRRTRSCRKRSKEVRDFNVSIVVWRNGTDRCLVSATARHQDSTAQSSGLSANALGWLQDQLANGLPEIPTAIIEGLVRRRNLAPSNLGVCGWT